MKHHLIIILFSLFLFNHIFSEPPSQQKLKMSFYLLRENFSLDNRDRQNLKWNEQLIPLADSCIESVLKFYATDIELVLEAIRTLYVEGNYYLRTEKFALAQKQLQLAKMLCENYLPHQQEQEMFQLCRELAKTHSQLPALYSLVLHHLGQIPIYYKDSSINLTMAETYLQQALTIREIIDQHPDQFLNVADNNQIVGDAIIFKRVLSFAYFENGCLDQAEKLCLSLLTCQDPYHQLLTLKQLIKIYQCKGRSATGAKKQLHYQNAMNYAKQCLTLLQTQQELAEHTRIASTYMAIGRLYADEHNPYQDLKKSQCILELGKTACPVQLRATLGSVKEELGRALNQLSQKELHEAIKLRWTFTEHEQIDSLKNLNDVTVHLLNYEKLGDVFLEQKNFILASAFYSNGLSLALKASINSLWETKFYQKLALTEQQFLNNQQKELTLKAYEDLIKRYKEVLERLRLNAKELLDKHVEIEKIYSFVLENYKALLQEMFEDLYICLGPPPCQDYAFIAFGSIGRGCVTPYSDIEFAILIKDESYKSYFQVLSELLCIRINALAESPIAGFNVDSMNWLTREDGPSNKGLRLDPLSGHAIIPHLPLGGQFELIATPQQLARIFDSKIDFPLHIKAVFYTCNVISGNEALLREYEQEMDRILNEPYPIRSELAKQTILNDLEKYYKRLGSWLKQENSYSIKYDFYRPLTIILDALAMQEGIHAQSPWQLVDQLKQHEIIDEQLQVVLRQSLDEVTTIQLRAYLGYGKQNYMIYSDQSQDQSVIDKQYEDEQKLFKIFQTILYFQNTIRKLLTES